MLKESPNTNVDSRTHKDTAYVPVDDLKFDPENPRFVDFSARDEKEIIKFLYDEADLNELVQSISVSGFIDYEPLLVLKENSHYIVLEGNRRLAAVRLLRSTALQKFLGISLPPLKTEIQLSTNELRVLVMDSRKSARAFIGFKHINGPQKWDSLAKAKYAAEWFTNDGNIQDIARTLGDTHNTVSRLVFGWLVLKQAENNGFSRDQRTARRFSFSHLYTALSRPGYRSYIGLSEDAGDTPLVVNPISLTHLAQLRELMTWLYGDRTTSTPTPALIQSQNPDLTRLNEVLQHHEARLNLMAGKSLSEAYEIIAPKSRRFADALIEAVRSANEALSFVPEYDLDLTLLENAKSLEKTSRVLVRSMESEISETERATG